MIFAYSPFRRKVVAAVILCFTIFLLHQRSSTTPDQYPTTILVPTSGRHDDQGYLPVAEASDLCAHHGWRPYPDRENRRKVYDIFLVNTELDWLEIRLGELSEDVDYFVVVEAPYKFVGLPKPLHVQENWDRFSQWHSRMIHHVINETDVLNTFKDTWGHETFIRNSMFYQVFPYLEGDRKPSPGDVILVSDIDEIPRLDTVRTLRNCNFPRRLTLASRFYYYSFQWAHVGEEWKHPQATYYEGIDNTVPPQELRTGKSDAVLTNSSWHCSSCLPTIDDFVTKVTSFSHTKYNTPASRNRSNILRHVRSGLDLFDRPGESYDRVDDNRDVPTYVEQHKDKFRYVLDRDPPSGNFLDYDEVDD